MTAPPYDIDRTRGVCAATGRVLEPGDRAVVVLADVPGQDRLLRLDYAEAAWDGGPDLPSGCRVFSKWRRTVPAREDDGRPAVDLDEIMGWFSAAADVDDAPDPAGDAAALRYLLALMLIRRRRLVLEGSEPASAGRPGRLLVRERTTAAQREAGAAPPLVEVVEPLIPEARLTQLAEQLAEVIDADA